MLGLGRLAEKGRWRKGGGKGLFKKSGGKRGW